MKKAIIIDHSYHKKTASSSFFHNIIKEAFDQTEIFWDDSWQDGTVVSAEIINSRGADTIFFFQVLYPALYYKRLSCTRIYHIPMYDGALGWSDLRWLKWRKLNFINFSSTLHQRFVALGMRSFLIQFYPDCIARMSDGAKKGILWPHRSAVINESLIASLIGGSGEDSILIHEVNDPSVEPVEIVQFQALGLAVEKTSWFESKETYMEKLEKTRYFMAPREFEGIGFTFLEAMACGACVIAANRPTMNEYIRHGENGILYNPEAPSPISLLGLDPAVIGESARLSVLVGRKQYIERAKLLITSLRSGDLSGFERGLNFKGMAARIRFHLESIIRTLRYRLIKPFAGKANRKARQ